MLVKGSCTSSLRLTKPAEASLTRSTPPGRKSSTQSRAITKFWAAQVRYPGWDFLARGEASSAARRRVSRVAVRARRRQWLSEAPPRPGSPLLRQPLPLHPVRNSGHPQKPKDGTNRADGDGYTICRGWSTKMARLRVHWRVLVSGSCTRRYRVLGGTYEVFRCPGSFFQCREKYSRRNLSGELF